MNKQRAALHADNVDALVFLNKNTRKLFDMAREVDNHTARFVKSEMQEGSSSAPPPPDLLAWEEC